MSAIIGFCRTFASSQVIFHIRAAESEPVVSISGSAGIAAAEVVTAR